MSSQNKREKVSAHNKRFRDRRKAALLAYEIVELVEERNQKLFDEVRNQVPIRLSHTNQAIWGAALHSDHAEIQCCRCQTPHAHFAHELLHLKFELIARCPGYVDQQAVFKDHDYASRFGRQLYNNMIHHRMYPLFRQMGYPADQFLEAGDHEQTRKDLAKLLAIWEEAYRATRSALRNYLMGGFYMNTYSPDDREIGRELVDYRKRIIAVAHPTLVRGINEMIADWEAKDIADTRKHMAWFFRACGYSDIGFGWNGTELIWARDIPNNLPMNNTTPGSSLPPT